MQLFNTCLQVSQDIGVSGRYKEAFVGISPGNIGYTRWVWGGEGEGDLKL